MNNLLNILILEAYQHDWSDLEIILTVLFCFLPWLGLLVYSLLKKFKITFVVSDDLPEIKLYFKAKAKITLPAEPVKEGYQFIGWYNDPDFEEPFIYETMPGKNLRAFAKFEKIEK